MGEPARYRQRAGLPASSALQAPACPAARAAAAACVPCPGMTRLLSMSHARSSSVHAAWPLFIFLPFLPHYQDGHLHRQDLALRGRRRLPPGWVAWGRARGWRLLTPSRAGPPTTHAWPPACLIVPPAAIGMYTRAEHSPPAVLGVPLHPAHSSRRLLSPPCPQSTACPWCWTWAATARSCWRTGSTCEGRLVFAAVVCLQACGPPLQKAAGAPVLHASGSTRMHALSTAGRGCEASPASAHGRRHASKPARACQGPAPRRPTPRRAPPRAGASARRAWRATSTTRSSTSSARRVARCFARWLRLAGAGRGGGACCAVVAESCQASADWMCRCRCWLAAASGRTAEGAWGRAPSWLLLPPPPRQPPLAASTAACNCQPLRRRPSSPAGQTCVGWAGRVGGVRLGARRAAWPPRGARLRLPRRRSRGPCPGPTPCPYLLARALPLLLAAGAAAVRGLSDRAGVRDPGPPAPRAALL